MILDSGNRTEFASGAVRDIQEGKGRMDLLPLFLVSEILLAFEYPELSKIVEAINNVNYMEAIQLFLKLNNLDVISFFLELSVHYQQGAEKYGEHNWTKGIPVHSFVDSGLRHLFKCIRGDVDERHDIAFVWNMLGAEWTASKLPELDDFWAN